MLQFELQKDSFSTSVEGGWARGKTGVGASYRGLPV